MLILHHIGCLTANIEESISYYKGLGSGSVSPVYHIREQGVSVCLVEQAPGIYLELVQPDQENKTLSGLLEQKKHFYHLGYRCDDLDGAVAELTAGHHHLVSIFRSEAFENRRCAFLLNPEAHLLELIEMP